jgi:hypothetical protein
MLPVVSIAIRMSALGGRAGTLTVKETLCVCPGGIVIDVLSTDAETSPLTAATGAT